jgi:hypothetical protein
MSGHRAPTRVDGLLQKVLFAGLAAGLAGPPIAAVAEQDLDQWIRVPFTGTITTQRIVQGTSQLGEMTTEMNETARLTATITRSVEVFNDQGDFVDWFPEGTVLAVYSSANQSTGPPEAEFSLTSTGEGTKVETYRYDPERGYWVDLEVNPGKRLYRLELPNVQIEGIYTETTTIGGETFESTSQKTWETGGELELGFMLLGERSYDPDSGVIAGSDSFDASQATDEGLRGTTVQITKGLEPGFWPSVAFTVSWTLRIGERPGRLLLEPDERYADWIPEGRPEQETVLSVISVTARLVEPEAEEGVIEFRLEDVSREPGACLNSPLDDDERGMDIVISTELNADLKISEDGLSAETFAPEREATVFLEARDYGAWARLAATATIVTGKGETEIAGVYEKLGTPFVPVPQDDDNNRIADAWQRRHGAEGQGIDDEDDQPPGDSKGDGLSLYEEYRGFFIQGRHQRLDPQVKDFFVYDQDGLVQDSFLTQAASPLKIHYPREDEMIIDRASDRYRVINTNHDTFHLVDQHGIVVIEDSGPKGLMGHCHGACESPGTADPHVSVYVDNIRQSIISRVSNYEEQISQKLGRPLDAAWLRQHIDARIRQTTTHEVGHAIGIEHHVAERCMPPGATQDQVTPSGGSYTCVMRYLYDRRYESPEPPVEKYPLPIEEHDDVLDILMGLWPWPDTFCDFCNCREQIRISDAVP